MNKHLEESEYRRKGCCVNDELALVYYKKALMLNPTDKESLLSLIKCLKSLQKEDQAKIFLRKCISIYHSYSGDFLYELGLLILNQNKKYKKARKYFRLAIKESSFLGSDIHNLGYTYFNEGNYERAFVCFQSCIQEVSYRNCFSINSLGFVYFHQGKFSQAIKQYKKVLRINSDYHLAYINWSLALICEEKYKESEEIFRKGVENKDSLFLFRVIYLYEDELKRMEKELKSELNEEEKKISEIKYSGI